VNCLTVAFFAALAALGVFMLSGCTKPEPFGENVWRGYQQIQQER
jgi:hypothetical protein